MTIHEQRYRQGKCNNVKEIVVYLNIKGMEQNRSSKECLELDRWEILNDSPQRPWILFARQLGASENIRAER